jgi:hypothetical protein
MKKNNNDNNNANGSIAATTNTMPNNTVDGVGLKESAGTTQFISDAAVVQVNKMRPRALPRRFFKDSTINFDNAVADFFKKPVVIANGTIASTDTVSTFTSIQIPLGPLNTNTLWRNKLDGYLGMRGTMVLRLEINANRFQQGRYMLVLVPTGGSPLANTGTQTSYNAHINTLTQRTQLQRIEMDINCDTSGTMRVPFNSVLNHWPISSVVAGSFYGNTHVIQLIPYIALANSGGSSNAPYTIWMSFEDVEMLIPAAPQMGRISNSEKEQKSQSIGPISSIMVKVKNAADIWSNVPFISSYANSVSWLADLTGRTASIFGWSKPLNLEPTCPMHRRIVPNFFAGDASDNSLPLTTSVRNSVVTAPGFSGTDLDEMDFKFITTIPAWIQTFTWATGDAIGLQKFQWTVSPCYQISSATVNGLSVRHYTPLAYVADKFDLWRGSIIYTFKVIKTEFHSGRLAVCFFPFEDGVSNATYSYANSNYVFREIIDIREHNEFVIRVPFVSSSPWKNSLTAAVTTNAATGNILVYVVDPLVAPANVPTSISIVVEIAGGPDMQFACPVSNVPHTPIYNVTPQMGDMDMGRVNECSLFEGSITQGEPNDVSGLEQAICIGENVSSFRYMMKLTHTMPHVSAVNVLTGEYTNVIPFGIVSVWNQVAPVIPRTSADLYSEMASIFCYSRGGVRLKFIDPTLASNAADYPAFTYLVNIANSTSSNVIEFNQTTDINSSNLASAFTATPIAFHHLQANLAGEVMVPQYHRFHSRVNSEHIINNTNTYNVGSRTSLGSKYGVCHKLPAGSVALTLPARGGADDCNFGCFISIPPMSLSVFSLNPY